MSALVSPTFADLRADPSLAVGDVVATSENLHPHYRVIAVTDNRAWIRHIQYGTDHIVPVDRCRQIKDGSA